MAPFTSSIHDSQSAPRTQADSMQFGEVSTLDTFDLGNFFDTGDAGSSFLPDTNDGNLNEYGPMQTMDWSAKQRPSTSEQQMRDNDTMGGIPSPATVDEETLHVASKVKTKVGRRKRSVDNESIADPAWVMGSTSETDEQSAVKKAKLDGSKRLGKAPTSRTISPRKRVQNRDAAQRYRRRKKDEEKNADHTLEELQQQFDGLRAERQDFRQEFEILRSLVLQ